MDMIIAHNNKKEEPNNHIGLHTEYYKAGARRANSCKYFILMLYLYAIFHEGCRGYAKMKESSYSAYFKETAQFGVRKAFHAKE